MDIRTKIRQIFITFTTLVLAACSGGSIDPGTVSVARSARSAAHSAGTPATRPGHVFVIVLENEGYDSTFGANTPAPYLATTLTAQGALLTNYYGIGHNSLDNYIAMVSGQAPNQQTQSDCPVYSGWSGDTSLDNDGQVTGAGCVLPPNVFSIADQLQAAGISWKAYLGDMGNDPGRDGGAVCAHPALNAQDPTQQAEPGDSYAVRHNPFMYFHATIDQPDDCAQHVINLGQLDSDMASVATTPQFVFITPSLCDDGHDSPCADGSAGGLARADQFLQNLVPKILNSPAYQQDGLLIITFDEASSDDTSACCGEIAGSNSPTPGGAGPGGGRVGAVLLSPFISPGTVSNTPYNHYAMLRSIEDLFGLPPLGFANDSALQPFGSDIFNNQP